jgi:hypothetical protein
LLIFLLVEEVALSREIHGDPSSLGSGDDFRVTNRSTRLNYRLYAGI